MRKYSVLFLSVSVLLLSSCPGQQAPIALIELPEDSSQFSIRDEILFRGIITDEEDLPDSLEVAWYYDEGEFLSEELEFSVSAETLGVGEHEITATVTDSDGMAAEDTVTISIVDDTGIVIQF